MNALRTVKALTKKVIGRLLYKKYNNLLNINKELKGKYGDYRFIIEYNADLFKKIKIYNDNKNIARLNNSKKIHIGFVVYTGSMWNVDGLYQQLKANQQFTVDIIIARKNMSSKISSEREYQDTIKYFTENEYKILEASLCEPSDYDILFYTSPYSLSDKKFDLYNIPLKTLVLHTSYSYMLAGNMDKIDTYMYHWAYRYYTDSQYYFELVKKSYLYTGNAKYLGFPKMDQFYSCKADRKSDKTVVIYAPHHSVNYSEFKSATFEDNYLDILNLAKKYSEKTYWIYKPHPLLRNHSVEAGLFASVKEYDDYEKEWQSLSNSEVVSSGVYFPVFKGSDGMITDSVSFLAEYQFTHKPLLLLESGKEEYNDFGQSIINILYRCPGNDIDKIEQFLLDLIAGKDDMKNVREDYFYRNLEYINDGKTANSKLYEDIIEFIGGFNER